MNFPYKKPHEMHGKIRNGQGLIGAKTEAVNFMAARLVSAATNFPQEIGKNKF